MVGWSRGRQDPLIRAETSPPPTYVGEGLSPKVRVHGSPALPTRKGGELDGQGPHLLRYIQHPLRWVMEYRLAQASLPTVREAQLSKYSPPPLRGGSQLPPPP